MRVFCSQCGTPNEGQPGTKVICTNCTSVFEVPSNVGPAPAPQPGQPKPPEPLAQTVLSGSTPPPQQPPFAEPVAPPATTHPQLAPPTVPAVPQTRTEQANWGAPANSPGLPGQTYPAPAGMNPPTHPLAIVSLVAGILCCIPLASTTAIVTGVIAIKKIDENPSANAGRGLAIAGIALGGVSWAITILYLIIAAATKGNY